MTGTPGGPAVSSAPLLVLDDSEDDVFFLRRLLQKAGLAHPLVVLHNGEDAVKWLEEASAGAEPLPLAGLFDLKMPGLGGIDVLRWMRERPPLADLPVIALTTSDHFRDLEVCRELRAQAYILKYPSAPALARLIHDVEKFAITDPAQRAALFRQPENILV